MADNIGMSHAVRRRSIGFLARAAVVCAAAAGLPTSGFALQEPAADATARRVIKLFDFEEPDNPEPVPRDFDRVFGPGFPGHNAAEFDETIAMTGSRSLRLPTQGGGTKVRVRRGEIPIFASADYSVSAGVRTEGLAVGAAIVSARLLDQHEVEIPGASASSGPIRTDGRWITTSLTIPGRFPDAAWLDLELTLEQPRQFTADSTSPAAAAHQIWREDTRGAAWFDDVRITQVPRAEIRLDSPTNIVIAPASPVLVTSVRDLGGDALTAELTVRDADDRKALSRRQPIDPGGRPLSWTPTLERFGWYQATLTILSTGSGDVVAEAKASFVWLATAQPERTIGSEGLHEPSRFGIVAEDTPAGGVAGLPPLLKALGTRFVVLPAWDPSLAASVMIDDVKRRGPALEALLRDGQEITLALHRVPDSLALTEKIDPDETFSLVSRDSKVWTPLLRPILDVYGQRIRRYQIGPTGDTRATFADNLTGRLAGVVGEIAGLVPDPVFVLPWELEASHGPGDAGVNSVSVVAPSGGDPAPLLAAAGGWGAGSDSSTQPQFTVVIGRTLNSGASPKARANEVLKQATAFWTAFGNPHNATPSRLALQSPWEWSGGSDARPTPRPELAALHTAMTRFGGRRVVGMLPSPKSIRAWILARVDPTGRLSDGAIVAWDQDERPPTPPRTIDAPTGDGSPDGLSLVDAFGNTDPVIPGSEAGKEEQTGRLSATVPVPIGPDPVFIEGVDAALAVFTAGLRFVPTFVPAVMTRHEHQLIVTNPWTVRMTGRVQIRGDSDGARVGGPSGGPTEWTIEPPGIVDFALAPGETLELPYTLTIGAAQLAGAHEISIVARVSAEREYQPVRVRATVEVGLEDLEMEPELLAGTGGPGQDTVIVAKITNRSDRTRSLRLEASARGRPDQQTQISELPPGQTIVKRLIFRAIGTSAGDGQPLNGRRVIVSVSDLEEGARLNKAVDIP